MSTCLWYGIVVTASEVAAALGWDVDADVDMEDVEGLVPAAAACKVQHVDFAFSCGAAPTLGGTTTWIVGVPLPQFELTMQYSGAMPVPSEAQLTSLVTDVQRVAIAAAAAACKVVGPGVWVFTDLQK